MQGAGRSRKSRSLSRGGSKQFLEEVYLADIKAAGVPPPVRQFKFLAPIRQWQLDFYWPKVNLVVEIEGGTGKSRPKVSHHLTVEGYRNDCEKYSALAEWGVDSGRPVTLLRFTGAQVGDGEARKMTRRVHEKLREKGKEIARVE